MQVDRFTKSVLTVIALCLVWICLRDVPVTSAAHAAPSDRGEEVVKVQIVSIDESPNLAWESLPVEMKR